MINRKQPEKMGEVYIARFQDREGEIPVSELGETKLPSWFKMYDRNRTETYLTR